VRGRSRSPKIGIFEAGSHRIVDIPHCGVHHPLINEVARAAKFAMHGAGVEPYDDLRHRGVVRALQVVVEISARESDARAQLVVVTNSQGPAETIALLEPLQRELGGRLHSLHWNGQPERSNTILGSQWQCLYGPDVLVENFAGARVFYPPGAFGQANPRMAQRLVERLHGWVAAGARVAEFYAGVGAVGLGLVERARELRFNEIGVHALAGLRRGIEELAPEERRKTSVMPGAAEACLEMLEGCDTVIVDPPRRGLDGPLRDALENWDGERLAYVSCGVDSFVADASALIASRRWRLAEVEAYGFFPFTEHVETLARFERGGIRT